MPKDTIERAISKGADSDSANLAELTFEGYAPNGIAIFVEATSDNNNRSVADIRAVFTKYEGELGTNGSLSFLFDRKGVFTIKKDQLEGMNLEELEMELIDGGLEELENEEDVVMAYTSMDDFANMQKLLDSMSLEIASAELQRIPNNTSALDIESAKKAMKLIEAMEKVDDVDNVYHNLEMTAELLGALEEE